MTGGQPWAEQPCLCANHYCRNGIYLTPSPAFTMRDMTLLCLPETVLTDEACQSLKTRPGAVIVSLDGEVASEALTTSMKRLRHHAVAFTLLAWVTRDNSDTPQARYRYWRNLGATVIHLLPQVHIHEMASGVNTQRWGVFLRSVFELWVREDVGRVSVQVFDDALAVWRGTGARMATEALPEECQRCPALRLCNGDCPKHRMADGRSALCEGYQDFFTWSAPYMRVMRDLLAQHRSPMELMAMLRQQPI